MGAELQVEAVLEAVEAAAGDNRCQQWRTALYNILDGATTQLEARALQVINRVAAKVYIINYYSTISYNVSFITLCTKI